jgi:multiple sugar transport system substrate-binding protein
MKRWGGTIGQVVLGVALVVCPMARAEAQDAIKVVSHRYPALEHYARAMQNALPGVKVEPNLMPFDKYAELATITLSQGSDAYDMIYVNPVMILLFAKNGWLEPIDDFWARYRAEYKLDDIQESLLERYRYQGKLYAIPYAGNTMLFFYRADLFKEKGLQPPRTFEEYTKAAERFHGPGMAGTVMSLKPVDAALNEIHWYFNVMGAQWFDESWKPTFNRPSGVKAIETLKAMSRFAPRGFTSHANDESTVTFQQGLAAMGIQWSARALPMDDPTRSRVVGKMDWVAPPGGGQPLSLDGYAISRFTKQNKETIFKVIATAGNEANMRAAAGLSVPTRKAILNDPELAQKYRFYPALRTALPAAKPFPPLPEMSQVGEIVTRRVLQAVTGEMEIKPALDAAAGEVESLLQKRGYYK